MIKESELLTAKLFGADGSLYVTTGTTTSNQIAAMALSQQGGAVLIDKKYHQSIHFIFNLLGVDVKSIQNDFSCEDSGRSAWDIQYLLQLLKQAKEEKKDYEIITRHGQHVSTHFSTKSISSVSPNNTEHCLLNAIYYA